jgi:hypothetical protein
MEKLNLIPFKTIDLFKHIGPSFNELKSSSEFEKLCGKLFSLDKTESYESNRGDLVRKKYNSDGDEIGREYWDHKNCKVISENQGGRDYFLKVKYSNVYSKLWVQMAMRELDEIMKHIKNNHKISLLRYKTEFNLDQLHYIDMQIGYFKQSNKIDGIENFETNSYCLKYGIDFYDFCDHLCRYNIRKYGNLLLIHDCPKYDYETKHILREWEENGESWYSTLPKGTQYLLTPIEIEKSLTYLDYIGFGGFKVVVNKFPAKKEIIPPDEMKPLFNELDYIIEIIEYQNEIDKHNNACNTLAKYIPKFRHCKYDVKDKWNFYNFEQGYNKKLKTA